MRKTARNHRLSLKKLLVLLVLPVVLFLFVQSQTKYWNGHDKVAIAVTGGDDVEILIFDPDMGQVTRVTIPGDTQVDSARSFGVLGLKSIWQLGQNEKVGGKLTAETVTKNFHFPIYLWAEKGALGLLGNDVSTAFKAVILPYSSNLGVGDKLKLAMFALRVKNAGRVKLNLEDTPFLKKAGFKDGGRGFVITGSIPENLAAAFADSKASGGNIRVVIRDGSGERGLAEDIGQTVEVLGPKVALITKESASVKGCEVAGKDASLAKKFAWVFECRVAQGKTLGNFDLEITLGEDFGRLF